MCVRNMPSRVLGRCDGLLCSGGIYVGSNIGSDRTGFDNCMQHSVRDVSGSLCSGSAYTDLVNGGGSFWDAQ